MNQENHGHNGPGESGDPGDAVGKLSLDSCLELLANRQRRSILHVFLDGEDDVASVDEIISRILSHEARVTGERPGHDTIAATLFHVHLPKFADANVLEYDTRHLEIRYLGDDRLEDVYSKIEKLE